MKNCYSKEDLKTATREFIYVLNELSPDQTISDMFDTQEVSKWLEGVVIPYGDSSDVHEFCHAAIASKKYDKFIINTFIESCKSLEKWQDLKVLSSVPLQA